MVRLPTSAAVWIAGVTATLIVLELPRTGVPELSASREATSSALVAITPASHPKTPNLFGMTFQPGIGWVEMVDSASARKARSPLEGSRQCDTQIAQLIPGNEVALARTAAQPPEPPLLASVILGLTLRDMPPHVVAVVSVAPNSLADTAGIKPGDELATLGHQSISSSQQFLNIIGAHRVGESVDLWLDRRNRPLSIRLTLAPRLADLAGSSEQEALMANGRSEQEALMATGRSVQALQLEVLQLRRELQALRFQLRPAPTGEPGRFPFVE